MNEFESQMPGGVPVEVIAEFDPRLADVWLAAFSSGIDLEEIGQPLAWLLRMAYLQGYQDAFSEPQRGALFKALGLSVPVRNPRTKFPGKSGSDSRGKRR